MKKIISIALFYFAANSLFAQQIHKELFSLDDLLGCWKVKDHIHDEESVYTTKQLKDFSKRFVCFRRDTIKLLTDTLVSPVFSIKKVNAEKYLWNSFQSNSQYFEITNDTLVKIIIKGILIYKGKKSSSTEYELFYDGTYLFLLQNLTNFRLYKPTKTEIRNSGG